MDNATGIVFQRNASSSSLTANHIIHSFTWLQWLTVFICLVTLTGNTGLLYLYHKTRSFVTPFSIYIISLSLINITGTVIHYNPFVLAAKTLISQQHHPTFCAVVRFCSTGIGPLVPLFHLSIALNRIWAVTWPLSYRVKHTKAMAACLCASLVVAIIVFSTTVTTIDTVLYADKMDNIFCSFSAVIPSQTHWMPFYNILFYALPEFVILLSYPYFLIKRRIKKTSPRQIVSSGDPKPTEMSHLRNGSNRLNSAGEAIHKGSRQPSNSFLLLSIMTLSVLICWSPANVTFLMGPALGSNRQLYLSSRILKMVQAAVDPVIFVLTQSVMRKELLGFMKSFLPDRTVTKWGVPK